MENFKDIDTTNIKHGQNLSLAEFRRLAGTKPIASNSTNKSNKASKNKKSKSNSGSMKDALKNQLPWHVTFTVERCRLDSKPSIKKSDLEYYYQVVLLEYIAINYPHLNFVVHASPNGGNRDGFEGARLKCAGAKKGHPDIQIMTAKSNFYGLFIEMKKCTSDYTSLDNALKQVKFDQHACREGLLSENYLSVVCYGFDEAQAVIDGYMRGNLSHRAVQTVINRWNNYDWRNLALVA